MRYGHLLDMTVGIAMVSAILCAVLAVGHPTLAKGSHEGMRG